jgi:alginate O-acetyltransferase complex protein AlgJ
MLRSLAAAAVFARGGVRQAQAATEPLVYIGKEGWLFPGWEHEVGLGESGVNEGLQTIARAHSVLASNGIACYLSMVPSKGRIYPEFLPANGTPVPEFMNRYNHALNAFRQSGIPAANCLDPMLAAKSAHLQYMKTDSHWTGFGSAVAAIATARLIGIPNARPDPLPDGVPVPAGTSDLQVDGDLVPLLPAGKQAGYVRDPLVIQEWTLTGGAAPAAYNVSCVGTSASKENLSFSQTIAYHIAQPIDLHWEWGSVGPWRMLTRYYEALKKAGRTPPKTLIWQFNDYILAAGPDSIGAWGKENSYPSVDAWLTALRRATHSA